MIDSIVLAVDEDPKTLALYQELFCDKAHQNGGCTLQTFGSAKAYLEALSKHYANGKQVAVSIIDMGLSGIHKLDVVKQARNIDAKMNILIVEASYNNSVQELLRQFGHNIFYICKPFCNDALYALVLTSIQHWKQHNKIDIELKQQLCDEIEKRKEKENMLFYQTRQAAMGEMISMIAHQWRQPITTIGLGVENTLLDIELETLDMKALEENMLMIRHQVEYLSKTIDDFRNFFLPNKEKEHVCIHECIEGALDLIGKSLQNNGIEIKTHYQDTTPLDLYKNELIQVIVNLLKNAKDAFGEHKILNGQIEIKTQEQKSDCVIRVSDNAGGIPQPIIHKIFDPYFTTKDEKNGTGLGLYMVKTIIQEHCCGTIEVENVDGGASFVITLPKICNPSETLPASKP